MSFLGMIWTAFLWLLAFAIVAAIFPVVIDLIALLAVGLFFGVGWLALIAIGLSPLLLLYFAAPTHEQGVGYVLSAAVVVGLAWFFAENSTTRSNRNRSTQSNPAVASATHPPLGGHTAHAPAPRSSQP